MLESVARVDGMKSTKTWRRDLSETLLNVAVILLDARRIMTVVVTVVNVASMVMSTVMTPRKHSAAEGSAV